MPKDGRIEGLELPFDPFAATPIPDFRSGALVAADNPAIPDPVSEEDAVSELRSSINDAIDFMSEAYSEVWELAQKYFEGGSSVKEELGQSHAVATVVRDAFRSIKPSVMRVLAQSSAIVQFQPTARISSELARQQSLFANSVFYRNGGYNILNAAFEDAGIKRIAPIKWWYSKDTRDCFIKLTGLSVAELNSLEQQANVTFHDVEEYPVSITDEAGMQQDVPFYDVELSYKKDYGEIHIAPIPLPEFFYSRNAKSVDDATWRGVIGHQRNMTVAEVLAIGDGAITYDMVSDLDSDDPELSSGTAAESTTRRRGVQKRDELNSTDPMLREILVTEAYSRFDLLGTGYPQLWRFILGGTQRELLYKERCEEVQICIGVIDPVPHTPSGRSLFDILREDQDVQTSALRGTLNNLHQANNRRLAYHDSLVNGKDVLSTKIGHPIRFRAPGMIQELGVTPVIGAALPLLEHLRMRSQVKVGVTDSAAGLDPDALQSTDKDAVLNTIKLSMGQIELITRNFAESLVPLFRGVLKLSIRHFSPQQTMTIQGKVIPVNTAVFDPDLFMEATVGIGTNNVDEKRIALQHVMTQQQTAIKELGPSNPFCDFSHVANVQEDFLQTFGIYDIDRYFKPIPAELGQQIAEQAAQQQQAEAEAAKQVPPPHVMAVELEKVKAEGGVRQTTIKAISDQRIAAMRAQQDSADRLLTDDLERDRMAQQRKIEFAKLMFQQREQSRQAKLEEQKLKKEQAAPRGASGGTK